MLGSVFWHSPAGGVAPSMYEESLTAFHRTLAAHPPSGFRGSTAFAFRSVPWFSAEAGYLDGSVAKTVEISNRAGLAVRVNYSAPQPERLVDEQDQANHIPFGRPPHLAFPDHVHRCVALNCS